MHENRTTSWWSWLADKAKKVVKAIYDWLVDEPKQETFQKDMAKTIVGAGTAAGASILAANPVAAAISGKVLLGLAIVSGVVYLAHRLAVTFHHQRDEYALIA